MIYVYKFLTIFFYPFIILLIFSRKFFKKEDEVYYKEKIFSSYFLPKRDHRRKLIWFHAASIGEVQSIFPLIDKLNENREDIEFLITTVTLSSGNLVKKKFNNHSNIQHRYFPIDIDFLMRKFLNLWKPDLIIFVDSEIWPNLILEIKKRRTRSVLINARITKKTFNRWTILSKFAKNIFSTFDLCLTSSRESKDYLERLNAQNIKYIGNLKLASYINSKKINNINEKILQQKKFWCAASTHKGEEIFCLKTHLILKKIYKDLLTIIIPRHISRSNEIKLLCNKLKLSSQILNDKQLIKRENEIVIVNSFGVLNNYFKYSKSVFIGKSLIQKLQKVGGQNPIEAAKLGCKIYHGPYVYNFKEIYKLLETYRISEKINNEQQLSDKLIIDLKETKVNENETTKIINNLGQKILTDSVEEINKILF